MEPVTVKIDAAQPGEMISPYIYGQFIEHLGRCINGGGIWAEMLEDRKFFYSVGDKESPWNVMYMVQDNDKDKTKYEMDKENPFVGGHSPKLGPSVTLRQEGLKFQKGRKYVGYVWLKGSKNNHASICIECGTHEKSFHFEMTGGDFKRFTFEYTAPMDGDGLLEVSAHATNSDFVHIGTVSLMPADNVHGMRTDTLECLKRLDSPIYRWPGGNFVSGYDWKDGIGDRDRRPPRKNPAWKGVEPNDFGVDEFLLFCKLLKTEPYIAVNTGDGGVENALAELEYVNGDATTPMGKLRAQNGHKAPYGVIWWGIGNEMYGNWQIGHMPVEKYVEKNNQFVDAFRKADPTVKTIAVGNVGKWDEAFLPGAAKHMDLVSEHFYVQKKDNMTEHVRQIPDSIRHIADAHRKYRQTLPNFKDVVVPIALDEWNYWYGDHVFGELGTRYFVKDGLGIAAGIHEFARQADMYFMANYAQTVNVIGCIKTSKTAAKMETTGLALELYRKHFGNYTLKTEGGRPDLDVQAALLADGVFYNKTGYSLGVRFGDKRKFVDFEWPPFVKEKEKFAGVKALTVGIVNSSDKPQTLKLDVAGYDVKGKKISRYEIADPQNDPNAFNDPDQPYRIEIVETAVDAFDGGVTVGPYSVTLLKFEEPAKKQSVQRHGWSRPFRSGFPRMTRPGRF